jgi:hypothetical protein
MKPATSPIPDNKKTQIIEPKVEMFAIKPCTSEKPPSTGIDDKTLKLQQKNTEPLIDIMAFAGICRGIWGSTPEEVDISIKELRDGRSR